MMAVNWRETAQTMIDIAGKTDDVEAKKALLDYAGKIMSEAMTPETEEIEEDE